MSIRTPIPTRRSSVGTVAIAVVVAFLLGPALGVATLRAQSGCSTFDPPCEPSVPFSIDLIVAGGDTVRTKTPTASYYVHGLSTAASSYAPNVTISTSTDVSLKFEAYGQAAGGSGTLSLHDGWNSITATYCDGLSGCTSATRSVLYLVPPQPLNRGAPIVAQEAGARYRRSLGACAGCAYATLSYSTPAYRSLDQDRSLTLLYSSATSAPIGTVALDVNANSQEAPDRISVSLLNTAGQLVTLADGQTELSYAGGTGVSRITAAFDAMTYSTAQHPMTAVVRNWWGATWLESRLPIQLLNINDRGNGFGSGWSVAGIQWVRLINGENGRAMIVENDQVILFESCGWRCWTSPPGEASTFSRLANGMYQRRYTNGSVVEFEPGNGLEVSSRDRLGVQTAYGYDAYQRLAQITDAAGQVTTIAWSSPPSAPSGAYITIPGGRTTHVELDGAGQLIRITDPDNVRALSVTYASNRINTVTNRTGGTTDFAYDSYGALASITGPWVDTQDRGWSRSTTTYRSREAALLPQPGTGTLGAPAARVFGDSAWLRIRTQRGDSTRVTSNGAGDPTAIVTQTPEGKLEGTWIAYNDAGQPRTVTSTSGTATQYDWVGTNLTAIKELASQIKTTYDGYNGFGQVGSISTAGTLQQSNTYSTDGRSLLVSSTSGDATTTPVGLVRKPGGSV